MRLKVKYLVLLSIAKNVTSNEDELNKLSKKVKTILSTKRLPKGWIDKFSTLNEAKNVSSGIF